MLPLYIPGNQGAISLKSFEEFTHAKKIGIDPKGIFHYLSKGEKEIYFGGVIAE